MARRKKTLLRDIDGVLADFLAEVKRTWGEPQVIGAYSLEEMYPMVSSAEIWHFVHLPTTYMHLKPLPGAIEADAILREAGWKIVNITCRPDSVVEETTDWLLGQGLAAPLTIFAKPQEKIEMSKQYEAVLEDNLVLARKMASQHSCVFLFDWPFNQGPCGNAIRIYRPHWENVLKELLRE